MRCRVVPLFAAVACRGGGGGGGPDAAVDARDAAPPFASRVCLAIDPRDPHACRATGAGGLVVTLGRAHAVTADDGTFAIDPSDARTDDWHVTGAAIVPSIMAVARGRWIPAFADADFTDLLATTGTVLAGDQGSLVVTVTRARSGVAGARASVVPVAAYPTRYAQAWGWGATATSARGVAWVPGVGEGHVALAVTAPDAPRVDLADVPIEGGAITFRDVALAPDDDDQ